LQGCNPNVDHRPRLSPDSDPEDASITGLVTLGASTPAQDTDRRRSGGERLG
jgi:hypothetical protein